MVHISHNEQSVDSSLKHYIIPNTQIFFHSVCFSYTLSQHIRSLSVCLLCHAAAAQHSTAHLFMLWIPIYKSLYRKMCYAIALNVFTTLSLHEHWASSMQYTSKLLCFVRVIVYLWQNLDVQFYWSHLKSHICVRFLFLFETDVSVYIVSLTCFYGS